MRIIKALRDIALKNYFGPDDHYGEDNQFPDESDEEYQYRLNKLKSYKNGIPDSYYDEFYTKKGRPTRD